MPDFPIDKTQPVNHTPRLQVPCLESEGATMKRIRSAIPVLFLFVAGLAYADSIQTFQITSVRIEIDSGPSVFVDFNGPGISVSGAGGMDCNGWCGVDVGNPPDFVLSLGAITLGSLRVEIGGNTYDET